MDMKKSSLFHIVFTGLFCVSIIVTGCSSTVRVPQWSGSGFIRKEFLEYRKVAVLPFEGDPKGDVSNSFAQSFHDKFPQMALLERKQLLGIFEEQDLYPGKLNEATRGKIGKAFGAQAVVIGNVYYPSIVRWLLQVQIIDIETGEMMGRSLVEINYMGAEGVEEGCKIAVQNLTPK
jgi:hypothetical protein